MASHSKLKISRNIDLPMPSSISKKGDRGQCEWDTKPPFFQGKTFNTAEIQRPFTPTNKKLCNMEADHSKKTYFQATVFAKMFCFNKARKFHTYRTRFGT